MRWIVVIAALALVAPAAARAGDQASPPQVAAPTETVSEAAGAPVGTYRPLDFWTKLKLGSAVFSNPQAVRAAKFAYSFDLKDFSEPEANKALWSLAEEGKVSFGIPAKGENAITVYSLSSLDSVLGSGKIKSPEALAVFLEKTSAHVVAGEQTLLGSKAVATFIKSPAPGSTLH